MSSELTVNLICITTANNIVSGRIQSVRLNNDMERFKQFIEFCEEYNCNEDFKVYDHEVAYMYRQDVPILSIKSEISATYGPISFGEIYRALRRGGINPSRRQKASHDDVLNFGQSGLGLEEIAKLTGYSERQVINILKTNTQNDNIID